MRLRLLPLGLLLAVCAVAAPTGPTPSPWKPKTPATPVRKAPTFFINGIADTGQFLPDTVWLIKVGPRITRVKDFVTAYQRANPELRAKDDSLGRVEFMNSIIHRDLLGLTARALNRPLGFEDRATIRETEERVLSDVFFMRYVVDSARVTDEEVQEFATQRGFEARFRRILLTDRPTAEQVRTELVSGKLKWEDAVRRYSIEKPTAENPDGNMGWIARMNISHDLGPILFRLEPGQIASVFRSDQGYEVTQMVERRAIPAPGKDVQLGALRETLKAFRVSLLADSIQSLIRTRIGMVFDTTNVRYAAGRFASSMKVERQGYTAAVQVSGEVPEFSPADTARVLARWEKGGRYSLGQFMNWYTGLNPMVRPAVTIPDALMGRINGIVLEPYRAQMARDLGLDKDPEAIGTIESVRERLLVEHMYSDSIGSRVWASREERKAYYEKHKLDYMTFSAVDYAIIYRYNRAGIDSLAKALAAGARPEEILTADSLRGEKAGSIRHLNEQEKTTYHKILFEELRPGQNTVIGPGKDGVYAVIHLMKYDPGRQLSYEEAEGMVDESAQNVKAEQMLKAWIARLSKRYAIESRPELVMRVLMVDRPDR